MTSVPTVSPSSLSNSLIDLEAILGHEFASLASLASLGLPALLDLYQRAIESSSCGIVIADMQQPDRPLIYCNAAFEKMTGYDRSEVLGRNCRFLQGPTTDRTAIEAIRSAIRHEQACTITLENYRKNGEIFWNKLAIAPVRDGQNKLTHYIGVQTDVTGMHLATQERETQLLGERLLSKVVERIRRSLDLDEVLATAVREVRDLLKTDRVVVYRFASDWTGSVVAESVEPGWRVSLGEKIRDTCFVENQAQDYQNGRICAIADINLSPLSECHKRLLRDYQVRANLVLPMAESDKLWGLLIAHECRGPRAWADDEIRLLTRLANQLVIAVRQAELYEQAQSEISRRTAAETALAQKAKELERALVDLKWQQARTIQTAKLASLGQLVAGIAHELNNPVSFIYGNVRYAEEYATDLIQLLHLYQAREQAWNEAGASGLPLEHPVNADLAESLETIDLDFIASDLPHLMRSMRSGANRIHEIVRSLRTFSHLQEADRKAIDLHENLESVLLLLRSRLYVANDQPRIHVIRQYGNLPPVACYPSELNQVLMNLLENAIDAIDEAMEAGQRWPKTQPPQICLTTSLGTDSTTQQATALISVADNGVGFSPEIQPHLYDPFFTTKAVGKGMGLGLSIAYQVITDRHGGKFTCKSSPEGGAEFVIELPLIKG